MRYIMIFLILICLVSTPTWAIGTDNNDSAPKGATSVAPTDLGYPAAPPAANYPPAGNGGYYSSSQGPQGPRGEKGEHGRPPTSQEILSALKVFEKQRENGYKIPNSFNALIKQSVDRKIIVGFLTPDGGIDYRWGKNISRAEMAQFVGRLLKVVDESDDQLRKEIGDVQGRLQAAQNDLQKQLAAERSEREAADLLLQKAINRWQPEWAIAYVAIAIFIAFVICAMVIVTLGGTIIIIQ